MKRNINENRVFSQELKNNDFQTEHMKNKIRNVKKKKKNINIKNIEPLVNIHDKPLHTNDNPIIEGLNLNPIVTFKDDEWTSTDDIYEGGNKSEYKTVSFAEHIEKAYAYLTDTYHNNITNFTKIVSGDTYSESDVKYVKNYFNWILSIFIGLIAVYNWIFITFYKDDNNIRPKLYQTPRDYIHNYSGLNTFFRFIDKFINIPLFFPDYLQKFFVQYLPDVITSTINPDYKFGMLFIFMGLFAILTIYTYNSGSLIKNILVDIASFEFSGIFSQIIYTITFILFILSFMESSPLAALLPIGGFTSLIKVFNPLFWIEKIIVLIYLIFLGVPLSTAFCLLYIIIHTFGSILIYKDNKSISEVISSIDTFLEKHKPTERSDNPCNPLNFWDKVINYIIKIVNFLFQNCITIGFLIVMIYALVDSSINIKSNALKTVIMAITIMSLLSVVISTVISIIKGEKSMDDLNIMLNEGDTPVLSKENVEKLTENLKEDNNEKLVNTLNNITKNL